MFLNIETKEFSFYIPIKRGKYIIFLPRPNGWIIFEEERKRIITHEIRSTCFLTIKIVDSVITREMIGLKGSKIHIISPGNELTEVKIFREFGSPYLFGTRRDIQKMKHCSFPM